MKHLIILISLFFYLNTHSQELYFPPLLGNEWDSLLLGEIGWCSDKADELDVFLENSNSKAFIVLKDGKRVIESYYDDFGMNDVWYWASAGKGVTAFLTGLAQQQNLLDINNPTSTYFGQGWTSCTMEAEDQITLLHQLTMTSGLNYNVPDPFCLAPECLQCLNEAGSEWYYHNAPYTHLSNVIEAASEESYTAFTNSELAFKIGFIGLWTFTNDTRLFWSKPRDMARFGLLMLSNGNWNGNQIMTDTDYFNAMIRPSQDINMAYGYLWWLNGQESFRLPGSTLTFSGELIPDAPQDLYAAIGKNGQILMVVPSEKLVIIRMGENPDEALVPLDYVRALWTEFDAVRCVTSVNHPPSADVQIYPNPVNDILHVLTDRNTDYIEISNKTGIPLRRSTDSRISTEGLPPGLYYLNIRRQGGKTIVKKFIKL